MTSDDLRLVPVTAGNWRDCAELTVHEDQKRFVADVTYYLCMCHYGDTWQPLAAVRGDEVVGFAIWGVDDDRSRWIGGVVVDAKHQRQGIGRELVRQLRERLIAEPGTPNVALSYQPENTAARSLYLALGFVETGETEGDEIVARWHGA
ncbi:spermidine acetyltransferase [Actinoplanes ianthinogenes]|uniref:Spermidine acetyltransferase n=1 Tax=Actinoplanes ianthinogenes TaxID=122358 RepID=A0ABM7M0P2_9ACTN|nr:GNAT family N-acetyltransferase [Actinoplanes ianthinogenes]BCJ45153.1 spermidine acetyltransferase [Actinoplanes ianthinogenes]GGR40921.1 spermidine acetyltransferase [Actinoplanes ianthinogenes]